MNFKKNPLIPFFCMFFKIIPEKPNQPPEILKYFSLPKIFGTQGKGKWGNYPKIPYDG